MRPDPVPFPELQKHAQEWIKWTTFDIGDFVNFMRAQAFMGDVSKSGIRKSNIITSMIQDARQEIELFGSQVILPASVEFSADMSDGEIMTRMDQVISSGRRAMFSVVAVSVSRWLCARARTGETYEKARNALMDWGKCDFPFYRQFEDEAISAADLVDRLGWLDDIADAVYFKQAIMPLNPMLRRLRLEEEHAEQMMHKAPDIRP